MRAYNILCTKHGGTMLEFNIISNNSNTAVYELKIIRNKATNPSIQTLIDTGASFPVWVDGLEAFKALFPDSKFANAETIIRGFGNGFEVAPIYIVPKFKLSDGKNEITYTNLPIAILTRDYSFNMIISFTMLNKLNYNFVSYTNRKGVKAINPIFRIHNQKETYHAGFTQCTTRETIAEKNLKYFSTPNIIKSVYIFTQ